MLTSYLTQNWESPWEIILKRRSQSNSLVEWQVVNFPEKQIVFVTDSFKSDYLEPLLTRSWCQIELERTEFLQRSLISKSNLIAYQANKIWVLKSWSNSPFRLSIPPYEKLHSDFTVSRISSTSQGIVYRVGNRKPKKEMQKNENKRNPTQAHGSCIRCYAI